MSDESYKKRAVEVIANYFGQATGEMYVSFYQDKSLEMVDASLQELLTESFGSALAAQIFSDFKNSTLKL